jgi:hypothetical protein
MKYEVSYIKTQWFKLLIALLCLGVAVFYLFSPAADTSTIEGLEQDIKTSFNFFMYFSSFLLWSILSFIDYTDKRADKLKAHISDLEARIEELEEHCITDLDPDATPGNYTARRRCGPDKYVPYPENY